MTFDPAAFQRQVRMLLDRYAEEFHVPEGEHALLRRQIDRGDSIHSRRTFPGHITTSALVLDEEGRRTLLIHHRALGRWLQPGGHYEPPDDLAASALREAVEETGLSGASGRLRGIMATPSDLLAEATHGTGLLTGLNH